MARTEDNDRIPLELVQELLEEKYAQYARASFISDDPIQLPRLFEQREDQEIIGFLAATIAWGQRGTIIKNGKRIVQLFGGEPFNFVKDASADELKALDSFVHRTFNGEDLRYFVIALKDIHHRYGSLEQSFFQGDPMDMAGIISRFKKRFFSLKHPQRTTKHVADPMKGSSAKRINMFLRWMIRPDDRGVDLGIWSDEHLPDLHVPLDVHSGKVARSLGLLRRKQNDWKAVVELTHTLRKFDPKDPVRFDIPLFAIGIYEPELINGQPAS